MLAKKLAPPGHFPSALAAIAGLIIGGFALLAWNTAGALAKFVALVCFLGAGVCFVYAVWWEKSVRTPQLNGWLKTWHCNRCGTVYSEPGAYDAYNETKPTRRMYAGAAAAVSAVCLIVVGSTIDSLAAADQAANAAAASAAAAQSSPAEYNRQQAARFKQSMNAFQARQDAALATDPCGVSAFLRTGAGALVPNAALNPPRTLRLNFSSGPAGALKVFHSLQYASQDGLCKVRLGNSLLVIPTGQKMLDTLRQMGLTTSPTFNLGSRDLQSLR